MTTEKTTEKTTKKIMINPEVEGIAARASCEGGCDGSCGGNCGGNCGGKTDSTLSACPLTAVLSVIGGKWKIPILCALSRAEETRYNELKRKVPYITNTMLANSLRELEADGLVLRHQYAEMPVRVEYSLTETGKSLLPILNQLQTWGLTHLSIAASCVEVEK